MPRNSCTIRGVMTVCDCLPEATFLATLRQMDAISRSRFRSPASLVYWEMIFFIATSGKVMSFFASPCSFICLGTMNLRAISSFSSSV